MLLAYLQLQILDFLELHIPSSKKSELELCQAGTIQSYFCPELRMIPYQGFLGDLHQYHHLRCIFQVYHQASQWLGAGSYMSWTQVDGIDGKCTLK